MASSTDHSLKCVRDIVFNKIENIERDMESLRDDMILRDILESLIKCTNNKNLSKRNKWLPKQNSSFEVLFDYTEDEYHSANEGYEGDTEYPIGASDDSSNNFSNDLHSSLISSRSNEIKATLTHIGLYKLIIDILFDICDGYLEYETEPSAFIIDCIRKLSYFDVDTSQTETLLSGFFNILQRKEERLEDLQQAILSLIHNLNSRKSLLLYLSLFKCDKPPLNILLEPLSSFTAKANEPAMFETFPKITENVNAQVFNFSAKIPHPQKKFFKRGFSITLWMKIETTKSNTSVIITDNKALKNDNTKIIKDSSNQGLHIVSYGLEDCLFEIWIIPNEGLLKYCIRSLNSSTSKLYEASILSFPLHNWQHLGVNVTPQDNCIEILTFLNFIQHYTRLPYPKKHVSQNDINYTPIFRLGHNYNISQKVSDSPNKIRTRSWSYHLTNIMIFHSSVLNRHNILDLIGLGPDCTDLTALDMGNIILNPVHVFNNANNSTEILLNNFDIVNNISHHIKKLQEHVCIIYTADRKDAIYFYPENLQTWADVGLPSPPSFRLSFRPLRPYVDQPMMIYNNNKNEMILKADVNMQSKDNNISDEDVLEVTEDSNSYSRRNKVEFEVSESNNSRSSIDSESEIYSTPLKLNRYYESVEQSSLNGNGVLRKGNSKILLSSTSENERKYTIADAVLLNGGVGYLLMFFARVVEISESVIHVANSLQFLLKISHSNIDLYSEFVRLDGLHLIHTVIGNQKCKPSLYMLKIILDIACSTPVLVNQTGSNQFKVLQNTKAVVVYPELIISIVRYYNAWIRDDSTDSNQVLDTLLLVIMALTRESHIHQEINNAQLTRVNSVQSFIVLCKDIYINRNVVLGENSTSLLVNILCNLAGSPPKCSIIGEIMQLTLLLHKDRDTYVTHSRSKFYFLLSDIAPKKLPQKPKIYPNRKTTKKQFAKLKRQRSLGSNTNDSVTSFENLEFNNDQINNDSKIQLDNDLQIVKRYETRNVQNDYYRKNPRSQNQPIDAKKLNKALTNLQIKQNGKKDKRYGKKKHGRTRLSSETSQRNGVVDISGGGGTEVTDIDTQIINTDEYVIIEPTDILNLEEKHNAESKEKDEKGKSTFSFHRQESFDLYSASVAETSSGNRNLLDTTPEFNKWTISLLEGLLLLVKDLILVLPDSNVNQILETQVRPEPLLVMANNANESVRAAIIKLLTAYVTRASTSELDRLVKMQYWYMLANQISSYPADDTLVNSVAALLTGSHLPIEEQLDLPPPLAVPSFTLPVIVSVLTTTLNDTALCHNYICFLRHIFNAYPNCSQNLLTNFLIETLLRCLVKITRIAPSSTDVSGFNEIDIIIQDIHIFLVTIMNKVIMMNAPQYAVIISDMFNQFIFLESSFQENEYTVRVLRETRAAILRGLIDILEDKIKGQSGLGLKSTSSYIATVLSSSFNNTNSKSKSSDLVLSKSEINIRFNQVFKWAVEFIVLNDPKYNPGETEINLFQRLLQVVLQGYNDSRDRCSLSCDLISWSINPIRTSAVIIHTMHGLLQLVNTKDFIKKLGIYTEGFVTEIQQFSLHIYQLRNTTLASLEQSICEQFVTVLGITDTTHAYNNLTVTDMIEWSEKMRILKIEEASESITRSVHKFESLCKTLIEKAMSLTREVNGEQSDIRGKHIALIRIRHQGGSYQHLLDKNEENHNQDSQRVIVKWWDYLIDTFTNERAQWHFPKSYPRSWEIDPTECPGRMRVRLRRTKLNIQERFLMEGHKDKLESLAQSQPFRYLQQTNINCLSGQRAQYSAICNIIELSGEITAEIVVGYAIYLIPEESARKAICCKFSDIIEICPRRYQLSNIGVEIFLVTGRTVLISLKSEADRDQLLKVLDECDMINRTQTDTFNQILQKWREREITNYDYLIALNKISGRSYNDLMQYPVFPWILADYECEHLNLNDSKSYRKLKKPIAIQHKEAEQHYINNYNYLKVTMVDCPFKVHREPYHYASHYSNSGTVLHFLVRLPPYTSLFLNYQDNNFDLPDRTFHSINTTWKLASKDSTTDVKELIPEFYYLPEFLINNEGFLFGTRQSGMQVSDVNLPSWCDTARTFILVHRQALEHPFVTENLPKWLDLIYGYKQTGKNALDAINLFHPSTYFGSTLQQTTDPVELQAWATMVKTYGQTPIQLLKNPHPSAHNNHPIHLQPPVISSVQGLRWGNYAGSPANADPMIVHTQQYKVPLRRLVSIPGNEIIALSDRCCVLSIKGLTLPILNCGHNDNVAKINFKKEFVPQSVFTFSKLDPITYCSTAPDFHQIWLGHQSGLITVHQYNMHQNISSYSKQDANSPLLVKKNPVDVSKKATLVGHSDSITSICICPGFKIAATGSLDGTAIIWDLNEISYVRSIQSISDVGPIKLVTISPTLGDIVTIHISNQPNTPVDMSTPVTPDPDLFNPDLLRKIDPCKSILQLNTINARKISEININEEVTSICYSSAPEGISVNVIVAGFATGVIRLFSSWDLKLLRQIQCGYIPSPVISVAYSQDCQHLFASTEDGHFFIWENPNGRPATPKFQNLTYL